MKSVKSLSPSGLRAWPSPRNLLQSQPQAGRPSASDRQYPCSRVALAWPHCRPRPLHHLGYPLLLLLERHVCFFSSKDVALFGYSYVFRPFSLLFICVCGRKGRVHWVSGSFSKYWIQIIKYKLFSFSISDMPCTVSKLFLLIFSSSFTGLWIETSSLCYSQVLEE